VSSEPTTNIYELLGVARDASPLLANELYWSKIPALLEAERRGEPGARASIDALSEALSIVSDQQRRGEYDVTLEPMPPPPAPPAPPRGRRLASGLLVVTAWVASLLVFLAAGPVLALVPPAVALLALLMARTFARAERTAQRSAFSVLQLGESASPAAIDLAYQSHAHALLARARRDPNALPELSALDEAYLRAMSSTLSRSQDAPARSDERRRSIRWLRDALRWAARLLTLAFALGAGLLARAFRAVAIGAARAAGERLPFSVSRRSQPRGAGAARRIAPGLAAEFRATSRRVAETDAAAEADRSVASADSPSRFSLLLNSPAGTRGMDVGERPLRIGSRDDCDHVLPRVDGVAPEHVMIWRHHDSLVLHVIDPNASCVVNGRRTTWARLEDGDVVGIGSAVFWVVEQSGP
jgi:hypothetical protein